MAAEAVAIMATMAATVATTAKAVEAEEAIIMVTTTITTTTTAAKADSPGTNKAKGAAAVAEISAAVATSEVAEEVVECRCEAEEPFKKSQNIITLCWPLAFVNTHIFRHRAFEHEIEKFTSFYTSFSRVKDPRMI